MIKQIITLAGINKVWLFPLGPWFGDPHITTTDGFTYTFNGEGEYLFTRIGDNDTVIQARTERVRLDDGGKCAGLHNNW